MVIVMVVVVAAVLFVIMKITAECSRAMKLQCRLFAFACRLFERFSYRRHIVQFSDATGTYDVRMNEIYLVSRCFETSQMNSREG